jgi:hypothetical protein
LVYESVSLTVGSARCVVVEKENMLLAASAVASIMYVGGGEDGYKRVVATGNKKLDLLTCKGSQCRVSKAFQQHLCPTKGRRVWSLGMASASDMKAEDRGESK